MPPKTELMALFDQQNWSEVLERIASHPGEVRSWDDGYLPIHRACLNPTFATYNVPLIVMEAFIESYPGSVKKKSKQDGELPLHIAVGLCSSHAVDVIQLLLRHYTKGVIVRDKYGRTPLHQYLLFCQSPFMDITKILVEAHPAAIHTRDHDECYPLQYVDACDSFEISQYLVEKYPEAVQKSDKNKHNSYSREDSDTDMDDSLSHSTTLTVTSCEESIMHIQPLLHQNECFQLSKYQKPQVSRNGKNSSMLILPRDERNEKDAMCYTEQQMGQGQNSQLDENINSYHDMDVPHVMYINVDESRIQDQHSTHKSDLSIQSSPGIEHGACNTEHTIKAEETCINVDGRMIQNQPEAQETPFSKTSNYNKEQPRSNDHHNIISSIPLSIMNEENGKTNVSQNIVQKDTTQNENCHQLYPSTSIILIYLPSLCFYIVLFILLVYSMCRETHPHSMESKIDIPYQVTQDFLLQNMQEIDILPSGRNKNSHDIAASKYGNSTVHATLSLHKKTVMSLFQQRLKAVEEFWGLKPLSTKNVVQRITDLEMLVFNKAQEGGLEGRLSDLVYVDGPRNGTWEEWMLAMERFLLNDSNFQDTVVQRIELLEKLVKGEIKNGSFHDRIMSLDNAI